MRWPRTARPRGSASRACVSTARMALMRSRLARAAGCPRRLEVVEASRRRSAAGVRQRALVERQVRRAAASAARCPAAARAGRLTGAMLLEAAPWWASAAVGTLMSPTCSRAGSERLVQVRSMESVSSARARRARRAASARVEVRVDAVVQRRVRAAQPVEGARVPASALCAKSKKGR